MIHGTVMVKCNFEPHRGDRCINFYDRIVSIQDFHPENLSIPCTRYRAPARIFSALGNFLESHFTNDMH